jgi:transposase
MLKDGTRFSRAEKLAALERMAAGENVSALARELGVRRQKLYRWREQHEVGGTEGFRDRAGRPTRLEAQAMASLRLAAGEAATLSQARRRIAELERKIGQQQLDLDFFKAALQHFGPPAATPGAPASSPSSRPGRAGKAVKG